MRRHPAAAALLCGLVAACTGGPPPAVPVASAPPPGVAGAERPHSSHGAAPREAPASGPSSPGSVDPVDPAEPGITDLARLARYVFRTMRTHEAACPFENPYRDRVHFTVAVEVQAGRMTRVGLGHAGVGAEDHSREITDPAAAPELRAYVACLAPHLLAVRMAPAPADGPYEASYQYAGRPDGRPAP